MQRSIRLVQRVWAVQERRLSPDYHQHVMSAPRARIGVSYGELRRPDRHRKDSIFLPTLAQLSRDGNEVSSNMAWASPQLEAGEQVRELSVVPRSDGKAGMKSAW